MNNRNDNYYDYDYRENGYGHRTHKRKYTWAHQLKRLFWFLLIPLGLLIPRICVRYPETIEMVYSRKIYPVIAAVLSSISSVVRSSLAEVLIIIIILIFAVNLLVRLCVMVFGKLHKRSYHRIRLVSSLISLVIFVGVMLNLFYMLWGLNNFREPVAYSLELEVRQYSVDELAAVYEKLASEAAELRTQVNEDDNGVFTIGSPNKAYAAVEEAYMNLGEANGLFKNSAFGRVNLHTAKSVKLSEQMSQFGTLGIYIPYTAEINVNVDQPDLYIPATAAHETAHFLGFAREDEANFIAFYVSRFSTDTALRYSAVMNALVNCGNALCQEDSQRFLALRDKLYTDGMNRDLNEYRNYLAKYDDGAMQQLNDDINDAYLKHNGQQEGIQSYGRMVDILLAYYDRIDEI